MDSTKMHVQWITRAAGVADSSTRDADRCQWSNSTRGSVDERGRRAVDVSFHRSHMDGCDEETTMRSVDEFCPAPTVVEHSHG